MNQTEDKAITLGHPSYVWRFGQDRRLELINRHAPLTDQRVLDVGCGLGTYVRKFRAFTAAAFGVDIDLDKLAQGAQELPNLGQSVAESLPFADGSFDVILLHEVIEHVRSDREAVAEAYRCLRPGGRVVIFAPNRLYPLETHGFYLGKRYVYRLAPIIPWLPDGLRGRFCPHVRTYRAGDIRRLFAGLQGEYTAFTQVYPGYDKIASRRPGLARLLRGATYLMERTPLRAFGISHLAVFRKPPA
jgi:SAM-dependent methyltransferase